MKYLVTLFAMVIIYACSAEIPESGRTVTEKTPEQTPISINVTNVNQNYLLADQNGNPIDNYSLGDNITISIVNSPSFTNLNCIINDNATDNSTSNQTNTSGSNTSISGGYTSTTNNTYSGGQTNSTTNTTTNSTKNSKIPVRPSKSKLASAEYGSVSIEYLTLN